MPIFRLDTLEQFAAVNLTSDPGYIKQKKQVPQCVEVVINWTLTDGKTAHNVLHGRYIGANPATAGLATALKSAFTTGATWTTLAGFLAPTASLTSVSVRDLNVVDQPMFLSGITPVPGTSASVALPGEVAFVVTLRTAKAGPANRGRIYIPAWATNALGANDLMAQTASGAATGWVTTNVSGGMNSNNLTLCIAQVARAAYGPGTPPQHPARPAGTIDVNQIVSLDGHWDTIRRRGLK